MAGISSSREPKPRPAKKRKARKRQIEERVEYTFRVTDWDYYYSLRPGAPKLVWDEDAYSELATLDFVGEILRPVGGKLRKASVTLSAKEGMLHRPVSEAPPSIGHLTSRGDEISGYIFFPVERIPEIIAAAHAGRIQFIDMAASKLRYRSASIYGLTLRAPADDDEEGSLRR